MFPIESRLYEDVKPATTKRGAGNETLSSEFDDSNETLFPMCGFPAVLEVPSSTAVRVAQRAEQLEEAVEDLLHLPHYHLHQGAGSTQDVTDVNVPLSKDVGGGARDQGLAGKDTQVRGEAPDSEPHVYGYTGATTQAGTSPEEEAAAQLGTSPLFRRITDETLEMAMVTPPV